jgi:hypothetical protein
MILFGGALRRSALRAALWLEAQLARARQLELGAACSLRLIPAFNYPASARTRRERYASLRYAMPRS